MSEMLDGLKRFLIRQNCWYLLSGFLMLLGCYLMSQAPGADSVELLAGLKLQGVVAAYQVLVVALAIYVRRKLSVENDAFNLACVALVLLPDPTFFSTRFWGHSFAAGRAVNGAALLVSAVLFVLLVELGKFPVSQRGVLSWLVALVVVFSAGAVFDPGQQAANAVALDLLTFAPLLLAALAGHWFAGDSEPAERNSQLENHPVLWGSPGKIYRRYLAAIILFYPFLVVLRHLQGLAAVFDQEMWLASLAPAALGAAILLVKAAPWMREKSRLLGGLCALSLVLAGVHDSWVQHSHMGVETFPVLLAAQLAFAVWLHWLKGWQGFPVHALACLLALSAGATPASIAEALVHLKAGPLAVCVTLLAVHAVRDGGFWEIFAAGSSALLLMFRMAPIPEAWAGGGLLHAVGFLYLACVHLYPRKDLRGTCAPLAAAMLLTLLPGVHSGAVSAELFRAVFAGELVLFVALGCTSTVPQYVYVSLGFGGLEVAGAVVRQMSRVDFGSVLWTWGGPAAVTLAFVALALGLMGTRERSAGRL